MHPDGKGTDTLRPDYKDLAQMSVLPPADQRFVRQQLAALPARINEAREREMGEMVGKLKEVSDAAFVRGATATCSRLTCCDSLFSWGMGS